MTQNLPYIPKCYKKDYYRAQFVREQWTDLVGEWDFLFDDENVGEKKGYFRQFPKDSLKIKVPFSYETPASGIFDETNIHEILWYSRKFDAKPVGEGKKYIINFEGADYFTKVWVNGVLVGTHKGGYCRFSVDATDCLAENGENILIVRCEDSLRDTRQPKGKQRWTPPSFGCWYVQTTGLWKPVWSEIVSETRLDKVKITPDGNDECVRFEYEIEGWGELVEIETEIWARGRYIGKTRVGTNRSSVIQTVDLRWNPLEWKVGYWSPRDPFLYDVKFTVYKNGEKVDEVLSYFGLCNVDVDDKGIRLNNIPIYQKLLLAQNYWKETGLTLPNEDAAIRDITYALEAGFNGMRIHQKIEDERFLFWCDVYGLFIWAEFPAQYEYGNEAIKRFAAEWTEAVNQQYNHPCVITWVPFNESWGIPDVAGNKNQQNFTKAIYALTKAYDPMRPVITNDGWEHVCSDILTFHDYDGNGARIKKRYSGDDMQRLLSNAASHCQFKVGFAQGVEYKGQPLIISECGGIAMEGGDGWGYNDKVAGVEALIARYDEVITAIKSVPDIWGFCYTQLTDVYQEVNGLLDMDHNPKVDLKRIAEINNR